MAERKVTARLSWDGVKKFTSDIKGAGRQIDQSFEKGRRKVRQFENQAIRASSRAKAGFSGLSKILGPLGIGLSIYGTIRGMKSLLAATADQEQAETRLASAIKNVRTASSDATDQLIEQAQALQKVTTFGDEQIISAQAMLATFQLNENQIKQIIPRLLDMAAATERTGGQTANLEQLAIALGKAFTGQVGLLSRYGVVLDETAVKSEGFNGILKSLDDNFKGIAGASGKSATGQMRQLGNVFGDFKEAFGTLVQEVLLPALPLLTDFITKMSSTFAAAKTDKITKVKERIKLLEGELEVLEFRGGSAIRRFGANVNKFFGHNERQIAEVKAELAKLREELKLLESAAETVPNLPKTLGLTPEQVEAIKTARGELTNAAKEIFTSVFGMVPALTAIEAKQINITDQTHKQKSDYIQINDELKKVPSLLELTNTQMAQAEMIAEGLKHFAFGIAQGFANAVIEGRNLLDVLQEILKQLTKKAFGAFLGAVVGALFGNPLAGAKIGAGFERGGRAPVGRPILVGERGPEIITLDRPGTVIPAPETRRMLERSVQNTWNIQISTLRRLDNFTIITEIFPTIEREMRRRGLI